MAIAITIKYIYETEVTDISAKHKHDIYQSKSYPLYNLNS